MKMRSPLSFTINLAIFSAASLPILAQSTPTIESLPNGDYFYGQAGEANKIGTGASQICNEYKYYSGQSEI